GFASGGAMLKAKGLLGVMEMLNTETRGNTEALTKFIPNVRAITGVSVMAGTGIDSMRKAVDEMNDSAGATDAAYGKMSETFEFQTKKFWNVVNEAFISIGKELMPIVLKKMNELSDWIKRNKGELVGFFKKALEALVSFGDFVINTGPMIVAGLAAFWMVGKVLAFVTAIKEARTALMALGTTGTAAKLGALVGPLGLVTAAIAGVAAGVYLLEKALNSAREAGYKMANDLKEAFTGVSIKKIIGVRAKKDFDDLMDIMRDTGRKFMEYTVETTVSTIEVQAGLIAGYYKELDATVKKWEASIAAGDFDKKGLRLLRAEWASMESGRDPDEMPKHLATKRRIREILSVEVDYWKTELADVRRDLLAKEAELVEQLAGKKASAAATAGKTAFDITKAHLDALDAYKTKGMMGLDFKQKKLLAELARHEI
ncbi:unnamed protein product, partial [marine sediment metagenome]